jgi:hypothetical protein
MNKITSTPRGSPTANTDLLIKNLRLLDLDEEFDWPQVRPNNFTATSTAQEQKSRVRCAEWIFYKLLDVWDPKEAAKLADYFPPLEPKQSAKLRAGLFQCLNELKKDGVLGKEIVLRRTMLDDCRGPKFEELLAVFSTMVLHKVLMDDTRDYSYAKSAITGKVVLEKQQDMLPLTLAYRASCSKTLQQREAYTRRWHTLGRTLRLQKDELEARQGEIEHASAHRREKTIPRRTLDRLRRHVDANWKGDKEWIEILTRSDQHRPQQRLLERDFDNIWSHACADTLYAVRPVRDDSLLQTLEARVSQQNERLNKWRAVQERLVLQAQAMGMKDEEDVQIPQEPDSASSPSEWNSTNSASGSNRHSHARSTSRHMEPAAYLVPPLALNIATSSPNKAKTPSATESLAYIAPMPQLLETGPTRKVGSSHQRTKSIPAMPTYTFSREPESPTRRSPERFLHDLSQHIEEQDDVAAQILSSVMNAEPSPFKQPAPVLSLAERTRMSMSRAAPPKPDLQSPFSLPRGRSTSPERSTPERPSILMTPSDERIMTLAERTRQSMHLMSARPRESQHRKSRVSRLSQVYPTNQFETPRKPGRTEPVENSMWDETMEDLDAEAIFKSRPRVAVSPILGPTPRAEVIHEAVELD